MCMAVVMLMFMLVHGDDVGVIVTPVFMAVLVLMMMRFSRR